MQDIATASASPSDGNGNGNGSASSLFQKASFLLYLVAVTWAFVYMLRNFLMPLFLAAVFTGLTYPIYFWLLMRTGRKVLSALLTLLGLVLVLVLPVAALVFTAYQEAVHFFTGLNLSDIMGRVEALLDWARRTVPGMADFNPRDLTGMATTAVQNAGQIVIKNSANISLALAGNLLNFFLMLFIMFYFYVDGPRIVQRLIRWSPLKDEYERILIEKFVTVSKGTLKGILVIGLIQASIATLLFWGVGLRSPVFLGALALLGTVIPAVGTALVWVPVAIMFLIQGELLLAFIVIGVGAGIIGLVDNLLRPMLVGKDIKMHDLLVLLSTLGGLGLFGLPGFILGPIIAALFLAIWNIFEEVFEAELHQNRQVGFRTAKLSQILKNPPGTEPPPRPQPDPDVEPTPPSKG